MPDKIGDKVQSADWKKEKHVPVIECEDKVNADEWAAVKVSVGKDIAHPNTTEHHIVWIQAYFVPDGGKLAYDLGRFQFNAHGASGEGPNTGPVWTHHMAKFKFKTNKPGTLNAVSYCNIHGLWESSKKIAI